MRLLPGLGNLAIVAAALIGASALAAQVTVLPDGSRHVETNSADLPEEPPALDQLAGVRKPLDLQAQDGDHSLRDSGSTFPVREPGEEISAAQTKPVVESTVQKTEPPGKIVEKAVLDHYEDVPATKIPVYRTEKTVAPAGPDADIRSTEAH